MTGQEYTRPPMAVQEYTCGSCMHRWHMPGACGSPSEVRCQCGDAWLAEVVCQAEETPTRGNRMKPIKQIASELWDEASNIKQYDKDAYSRISDLARDVYELHESLSGALGLTAGQERE